MSQQGSAAGVGSPWSIHPREYFDSHQASILAFHNDYAVGRQGGIEIIQHGKRLASCGFLFAEGPRGHGFSELKQRTVRHEGDGAPCVEVLAGIPGTDLTYPAVLRPEGDSIRLRIVLEKALASAGITSARFDMALAWTFAAEGGSLRGAGSLAKARACLPMEESASPSAAEALARARLERLGGSAARAALQLARVRPDLDDRAAFERERKALAAGIPHAKP